MVGGLTSREVLQLVAALFAKQPRVVGADLVEVVPRLDVADCTCALAAHLLALMVDGIQAAAGDSTYNAPREDEDSALGK
jgi:arginase family enzyme